jgi:hypothetical protein
MLNGNCLLFMLTQATKQFVMSPCYISVSLNVLEFQTLSVLKLRTLLS